MTAPRRAKRPGSRYDETDRALELMRQGISPWSGAQPRRAKPRSLLRFLRDQLNEAIDVMFGRQ